MRRASLLLGASLASSPVRALEVGSGGARVDVTSTTVGAYHTNNDNGKSCDDDYYEVFERLNVVGQLAPWSAGLRLDGSFFSSTPEDGEGSPPCAGNPELFDRYFNEVIPEKVWVAYTGRRVEATLGDSYVQFGRGLALSLRKVDELGVDTSLRGGKVLTRLGPVDATWIAGGTNIGNVDEATGRHADDPLDLVGGARAEVDVAGRLRPGAHAVVFAFHDRSNESAADPDDYGERWIHIGPTLDAPRLLPFLGLYLEALHQRRDFGEGPTQSGNGLYGTVTMYRGPATVLVEGKAYGDLAVVQPKLAVGAQAGLPQEFNALRYTSPPTVERVLQPLINPQRDIAGGRTQIDWRFSPALSAFASYGVFRDDFELPGSDVPSSTVHDPYAGVDLRWNDARSRALISFGERFVVIDDLPTAQDRVRGDLHADAEVSQVLTRSLSAEGRWQHLEREEPATEFREGTIQAGVRLAPWTGAAMIIDYSTEQQNPSERSGFGDIFPGGVLDVSPAPSSTIRLFAGASRGGLRCVSGVCRVFPPFEGVKLTATVRF